MNCTIEKHNNVTKMKNSPEGLAAELRQKKEHSSIEITCSEGQKEKNNKEK